MAPPTIRELMGQIRARVKEATPSEVKARIERNEPLILIDVREKEEVAEGQIPGAIHIPRGFLELRIENLVPDRTAPIVAYCAGGNRSLLAAEGLKRLGYENVVSMSGGFGQWRNEGKEIVKPRILSEADRRRYSRHLIIPEVGEAGQMKLLDARVLLVGAGGLGCPAAFYLAAAGVGTLGILDFDAVDESNLQRQILHTVDRVGTAKTESARKTLLGLNPGIRVIPIEARLTSANVESIFRDYDIIVDGSDNFPTRYLVNDACFFAKKTLISGSIFRFEGQLTVLKPNDGFPCYRCLYAEPPPAGLVPNCQEAGVLGVLAGTIGVLQAAEAIKEIVGFGTSLAGSMLIYDALEMTFRKTRIPKDPACPLCGANPRIKDLSGDYTVSCSI